MALIEQTPAKRSGRGQNHRGCPRGHPAQHHSVCMLKELQRSVQQLFNAHKETESNGCCTLRASSHTCSAGPSCSLPRDARSCPAGVAASGEGAHAEGAPGATVRLGLLAGRGPTFR